MVYIASPLRGDYDANIKKAIEYCKTASDLGVIPLAPHTIFSQWCNDTIPAEREKGLELGLSLLSHCDELWVMGKEISEGMRGEIYYAQEHNIPTHHVDEPEQLQAYPISHDENRLLGSFDVVQDSLTHNYEDELVIVKHKELKPEYKTPINQLWIATHGPGCKLGASSDTVHLTHPIDKDKIVVGRADILGIAKPELVEELYQKYHVNDVQEAVHDLEQEDEDMSL